MNKLIISYDESQEDIPTLVVSRERYNFLNPNTIEVDNIITGDRAKLIWQQLTNKDKGNKNERER